MGTNGTTEKQVGNTKYTYKRVRNRARSWFFTLNNYTPLCMDNLAQAFQQYGSEKYIFQEEIGENKTPHLQGIVSFGKRTIEFSTMKKISDKAHWEKCQNLKAAIKYCSKKETRVGKIIQYNIKTEEMWHEPIEFTHLEMCASMRDQCIDDLNREYDLMMKKINTKNTLNNLAISSSIMPDQ